jgi:GABA(A) receptor-associated protein
MPNKFKKSHSLKERIEESKKIMEKYDDRIPIVIFKDEKCKNIQDINKNKFLAPSDLTIGQFLCVVRKRIELDESQALFIFVDESTLAAASQTIGTIYQRHKDEDGFLYMIYCSENVFG